MSRASTPARDDTDEDGAEGIYREHPEAVEELAERDDRVGAVFQAIKDIATEDDDADE